VRRAAELLILFASLIAGAVLRFTHLGNVSFWLDEIVSYDVASEALRWPWWRWLAGVEPEHGPLFFALEVAGRLSRSPEFSARIAPALCGVATIAVGWFALRRMGRPVAASAFAILIAISPLNVYYSREGRPYALLMLLATAIVAAIATRARPWIIALLLIATLYTSAIGAPLLLALAVAAGTAALFDHVDRRRWGTIAAIAALCAAATPLLYHASGGAPSARFPRFGHAALRGIVESFSVVALDTTEHHRVALLVLLMAIAGAVDLVRRSRGLGIAVIAMSAGTIALTLLALARLDHWFAIRYLSPALPLYLLLAANGIAVAGELLGRRSDAAVSAIACIVAIVIASQALPAARNEPLRKLDWRGVAKTIYEHAHYSDWIIASSDWSARSLGFYLRALPPKVRLVTGGSPDIVDKWPGVWIVSAGSPLPWTCRYPVVLSDRIESLQVRYAPSLAHFLASRSTAPERHALALTTAPNGRFALGFGPDDDPFLVSGWGGAERAGDDDFRWAIGTRAVLFAPFDSAADRRITIRAMPFGNAPQRTTVTLNDTPIATMTLLPGWRDYAIDTHAAQWRRDAPNVIAFEFEKSVRPSDIDPRSQDHRPLAACFTEVRFNDGTPSPRAYIVRLDEALGSQLSALGENRRHRVASQHASRLPASLVQLLADASECLDDAAFVHVARSVILDARERIGDAYFINLLRQGATRTNVIDDLIDELNRKPAR